MSFVDLILLVVAFVVLAISGGFATNGAVRITGIKAWDSNTKLKNAHHKLTIAAVVAWITVAAILILGILYLIFGSETIGIFGSLIIYIFLIATLVATGTVGILSAIAAEDIQKANVKDDNESRRQAIIAASLALVGFVSLIIVFIIRLFDKPKKEGGDESQLALMEAAEL